MYRNLDELVQAATAKGPVRVAVAVATGAAYRQRGLGPYTLFCSGAGPTTQDYVLTPAEAAVVNAQLAEMTAHIRAEAERRDLAYFDLDLYQPTKKCLQALKKHITRGTVLGFDELNYDHFPGETQAFREELGLDKHQVRRSIYSGTSSYIIVE